MNKDTKPNYAGSHKSIRMKGSSRGHYTKNKYNREKSLDQKTGLITTKVVIMTHFFIFSIFLVFFTFGETLQYFRD